MTAEVHRWLHEPPPRAVQVAIERLARAPDVDHVAVMPDVHLARDVCVGVAVATNGTVYPQAVGGDIGCGMAAVRVEADAVALSDARAAATVLDGLATAVPGLRRPRRSVFDLPSELVDRPLSHPTLERQKARDARVQLGTVGRGNHFVELQSDESGSMWLMVHSGSRGVGRRIHEHHLVRFPQVPGRLRAAPADSPEGVAYLDDLAWAVAYAEANRLAIVASVERVLRASIGASIDRASLITCDHNHVREERHGERIMLVHRKGAIPAGDGTPGIVPGSMGSVSHHTSGRGCPRALATSAHGAGRAMDRTSARRRITVRELRRQMRGVWFDHRKASRLVDEAPAAYKDIGAVMRAQRELTRIRRTLRPLLVYKS